MADIYVATTGNDATGNGSSGNPYATPGKAGSVMAGGDRVLIKAGTYTQTSASANVAGGYIDPPVGTAAARTQVVGYNATVGDLDNVNDFTNFPTIKSFAGGASTLLRATNNFVNVRNLIADCNSQANYGFYTPGDNNQIVNCKAINQTGTTQGGFYIVGNRVLMWRCLASSCGVGFNLGGSVTYAVGCVATGCTTAGFTSGVTYMVLTNCIAYGNTGGSTDGFQFTGATTGLSMIGCVSRGNGRDGLRITVALTQAVILNSVFTSNTGYGINSTTTNAAVWAAADYNAFYSNTAGARNQLPAGDHDVTLSGDPFTNAASGDFSLNSTAGAGLALQATGWPGVFPGGLTTGYGDIGAAQHQASGGGGATMFIPVE
jgi:hypothetical protein